MTSDKEMERAMFQAKIEIVKDLEKLIALIQETKNGFDEKEGSTSYMDKKIKEIQGLVDKTKDHLERLKQTEGIASKNA